MSERTEMWKAQVEEDPGNELARFSLARAHFDDKDWGSAMIELDKALELSPDWMMAAILRGQCLIKLGRIDEAKAALLAGKELAKKQGHKGPQEEIDEILAGL